MKPRGSENRVLLVLSQSKWRLFDVFSKYTVNFTHVLRLLPYSQLLSTPTTPNWETFKTSAKKQLPNETHGDGSEIQQFPSVFRFKRKVEKLSSFEIGGDVENLF